MHIDVSIASVKELEHNDTSGEAHEVLIPKGAVGVARRPCRRSGAQASLGRKQS